MLRDEMISQPQAQRQRFLDILDNIARVREYLKDVVDSEFVAPSQTYDATAYCFMRLSEAVRNLGKVAEELEPQIDWRSLKGLGNHLQHRYDRFDAKTLWSTYQSKFPQLEVACLSALTKLPSRSF